MPLGSLLSCCGSSRSAAVNPPILKANTTITVKNIDSICARLQGLGDGRLLYLMEASTTESQPRTNNSSISILEVPEAEAEVTQGASNVTDIVVMLGREKTSKAATQVSMLNWLHHAVVGSCYVEERLPYLNPASVRRGEVALTEGNPAPYAKRALEDGKELYLFKVVQQEVVLKEGCQATSVKAVPEHVNLGWLKGIMSDLKEALTSTNTVVGFDAYAVEPTSFRANYEMSKIGPYSSEGRRIPISYKLTPINN